MKTLTLNQKTFALVIAIMAFSVTICKAQSPWARAQSSGCWYHTSAGSIFTWSGGCRDGYCDGNGTIQWYDSNNNPTYKYVGQVSSGKNDGYGTLYYANGYVYYRGEWADDLKSGIGTTYYDDGSIQYKGAFVNDEMKDIDNFNTLAYDAGNYIMNKFFDGGINLRTKVIELINTSNGDNELKVRVTFNGNIVSTNYYAFTLVLNKQAPYVHFENINDMASVYMLYRISEMAKELDDYLNKNQNQ